MSGKETERKRLKRRDRSQFRERYREPDRQTDRDNLRKYHRQNVGQTTTEIQRLKIGIRECVPVVEKQKQRKR